MSLAVVCALAPQAASAQASRAPKALPPAQGGMRVLLPSAQLSYQRLERITAYFNNEVATGKIPGANVLVQRHGVPVYFRSFGKTDVTSGEPMRPETIFRLHSLTKPITSAAAMLLVDDGRLKLDDPVSKYIPAFADAMVGVEGKADNGDATLTFEKPNRQVTIADLLRHSSGITYGFFGTGLVRAAYADADLYADDIDNKRLADKIAALPLADQPGTVWNYGHSTDVLGRVIEVISGKPLYDFERERLFGPLGMNDTAYYVSDPAKHRLIAEPLPSDTDFRTGNAPDPKVPPKWQSGGGGLLSTVGDMARFCQMILNGGSLDGTLYFKPDTFVAMTANQIVPKGPIRKGDYYFPGDGFGFTLGFAIRAEAGEKNLPGSPGELKWDGAGGTYFWIDAQQDMFAVLLIQSPSERGRIQDDLKKLVYDSFEAPR
ncbi:MAG TPA: serine hydrolase domain-containing protein [Afipia sp.]